jgi:hypothetical protein
MLFKWLNRRSQKSSYTWEAFQRLTERYKLPAPKIVEQRGGVKTETCQLVWKFGQALAQDLYGKDYRPARA